MFIRLGYEIGISCNQPTEIIALLDVHPDSADRIIASSGLKISPELPVHYYLDAYGNSCLRFTAQPGEVTLYRDSLIEDDGQPDPWDSMVTEAPVPDLPDEVMAYLLASRYCETDLMMDRAWGLFGHLPPGWARVRAIFDHVDQRLTFGYQYARATRTAAEAYDERIGVCRDFAHLAITLCRCMNIPARYVNGYLGDIGVPPDPAPMDFNAWCEVWLGGRWITLDARHNQPRIGRIVVARGRDATDIPLIQSFGPHMLTRFRVWTEEEQDNAALTRYHGAVPS
ncbi:transglutaminase-like domain-containing protein [Paenirhodobacter populi]|uniref:Transglutaminase family protein n=1 Tax=Paenirhodobacter populi TaxID=2306993 RepID=A0A443JBK0_9RHOB|nr:transglutaminase family protein [Sinirhodobacter populi]RWR05152.1 transglutaminase family protein [Sinirhodobacter populi]RWR17905.1 transglutaminase family protein [Sinirhodobacter populi]RWR27044.1 transglutaminase family protein [Sinirhodobacter populi]